jgi:carbamoyltransferase
MLILGISELDCDSGAALLRDGVLVGAANEERFTRVKQQEGNPNQTIDWLLKQAGAEISDVDLILAVRQDVHSEYSHNLRALDEARWFSFPGPLSWRLANWGIWRFRNRRKRLALSQRVNQTLLDWARDVGVDAKRIERPDHHFMHATCAYYGSGFDKALAFTADGQGDGKTATLYSCDNGRFEHVHSVMLPHSPGNFYSAITMAAGYRPFRHEGKITGLAARGRHDEECMTFARRNLYNVDGSFEAPYAYGSYPWLKSLLKRKGPENLAYAYQHVLEDVLVEYVRLYVRKTGATNLCMAGGVCANVSLNRRLHEIPEIENVFIFPHMADGGLGWGAAQYAWHRHEQERRGEQYRYEPKALDHVYWGPTYDDDYIAHMLQREGARHERPADMETRIADLLADGELVARFHGAMEFGPRALCHRSILYQPTDPTVNDWLNERLHRTEFMPFAPVTIREDAASVYKGLRGAEHPATFMTITFECTDEMARTCPAVVHLDKTARPQLVGANDDASTYKLLMAYKERTGLSSMINTSFNMHEEPIVCSPEDALRAAKDARFRYLAIGPFLVELDAPSPPPAQAGRSRRAGHRGSGALSSV